MYTLWKGRQSRHRWTISCSPHGICLSILVYSKPKLFSSRIADSEASAITGLTSMPNIHRASVFRMGEMMPRVAFESVVVFQAILKGRVLCILGAAHPAFQWFNKPQWLNRGSCNHFQNLMESLVLILVVSEWKLES